ncbi:MAG: UDP-N-acetylmuramoyl-L-alanyl-D-glutamate--2,6-diaminopimelate ligase [Planctomycetes bacterium]|nr:UDP-N-acetylmuramoyl-L-alanyl-D-glutamate--2,6-diaminopimelate ligase [Planctomycetota bacterium]
MKLQKLIQAVAPVAIGNPHPDLEITGISFDSRKTQPGHLFAALPGLKVDGATFARTAVQQGAAAILTESDAPLTAATQLVVKDARAALTRAARAFYGEPDRSLRMGAVTGTNGKSTTAYLIRHLLRAGGNTCGLLGTIEYDLGDRRIEAPLTTPEAPELFSHLRSMADAGCSAAVMEVSSHSLCQRRVEGIDFACGVFTNLTQDHLDYHRTMDAYRDAKGILFENLSEKATAVVNLDDVAGTHYAVLTPAQVLGYSMEFDPNAELCAEIKGMDIHGTKFVVHSPWGNREVHWRLVGKHNVENALAALGASLVLGVERTRTFSFDGALNALESFAGVPGRLEPVGDDLAGFRVLVDYAHTDDALRSVMESLNSLRPSRLIVVFGCGGDRDRGKRPKMAAVVERLATLGVITSDNPRTEDPRAIIGEIWAGVQKQQKFIVEPDRAKAIDLAIREARTGDVVLIAGKGHEDYQIVGTTKFPFDDRKTALAAMERRVGAASRFAAAGS